MLIKGYIDRFYKKHKGKFETKNFTYVKAEEELSSFALNQIVEYYSAYIDKSKKDIIDEIKKLVNNIIELIKEDYTTLPRIYFDNHIYIPILLEKNKNIEKISPCGLVESEEKFVKGLREYLTNNSAMLSDCEVYLLRNEAKSGVGFQLDWASFYPDFIMWVKKNDKTCIVFIDPKGLHHTKLLQDEKIQFAKNELKEIERQLNICLEAFIISDTKYENLIKGMKKPHNETDFENYNVLFFEDPKWCEKMFNKLLKKYHKKSN